MPKSILSSSKDNLLDDLSLLVPYSTSEANFIFLSCITEMYVSTVPSVQNLYLTTSLTLSFIFCWYAGQQGYTIHQGCYNYCKCKNLHPLIISVFSSYKIKYLTFENIVILIIIGDYYAQAEEMKIYTDEI
jgi:hypothetical protein